MRTTKIFHANDTYLELVREFPLRRLKNREQHADAVKAIARVSLRYQGTQDTGVLDYLDVLAGLIDQFELASGLKVDLSRNSPKEIVRHLMEANGLTATKLAREIGVGQSNLSEMLAGRRAFSKRAISGLHDRFGLSPEIFF